MITDWKTYWRERSAKRREAPAYREQQKERYKQWADKNRGNPKRLQSRIRSAKTYYANHPEKAKAKRMVRTEIEAGRLVRQPCEVCGKLPVDAHHDDYSQPLKVRWLCRKHHNELHNAKAQA